MEAKIQAPIFACFGNDDYDSTKETLRDIAHDQITFLDDEIAIITVKKKRVGIVGSRGVLDRPTFWQARNLQGIRELYTKRIRKLDHLLAKAKAEADYTVFLTHYTPTYLTLQGETQRLFAQMGSKRIEKLLFKHSPTLVVHGHAHHGKKQVALNNVQIFNVALPLNRRIVKIKLP